MPCGVKLDMPGETQCCLAAVFRAEIKLRISDLENEVTAATNVANLVFSSNQLERDCRIMLNFIIYTLIHDGFRENLSN